MKFALVSRKVLELKKVHRQLIILKSHKISLSYLTLFVKYFQHRKLSTYVNAKILSSKSAFEYCTLCLGYVKQHCKHVKPYKLAVFVYVHRSICFQHVKLTQFVCVLGVFITY